MSTANASSTAPTFEDALKREKQIKAWTRAKRVALIQVTNPWWNDLSAAPVDPSLRSG